MAGGCSGLTWDWEFCGRPAHAGRAERPAHPGDLRKTTGGVTIVVDPASAPYLRGASIGVAAPRPGAVLPMAPLRPLLSPGTGETITLARLPARTTCGCGESFPAA
ncbi:MAG: hypothetical protein HMLKMBBP_00490 [Planctomycetes bacterium]|nr:hypothetical protein [Planctomycetota bacterium]